MAVQKLQRLAGKKATSAMATTATMSKGYRSAPTITYRYKYSTMYNHRYAKRSLHLPKGKLSPRKASHIEHLANARNVKDLAKAVGCLENPIQTFNHLKPSQKKILMRSLLLNHCLFSQAGGTHPPPADYHDYSKNGLPATDQAVYQGKRLFKACEHIAQRKIVELGYDPTKIHGQERWPPNLEIESGCLIKAAVDGRVNLEHDPYCLRKHFTSRWGVLMDQSVRRPPERGASVAWEDSLLVVRTEGKEYGLWVDLKKGSRMRRGEKRTRLTHLISSPWLLHRIVANFAAPPDTQGDPLKCSWSFIFWNQEDPTCYLEICELKGCPTANFRGNPKASNEALQLLAWLGGVNCPLSYDYTPCGIEP